MELLGRGWSCRNGTLYPKDLLKGQTTLLSETSIEGVIFFCDLTTYIPFQDLDESSQSGGEGEIEEMGEDVSEDLLAGEATPISAPSMDEVSSPDEQSERSEKAVVEVFDLQESSGDDISPDMESQALFVKLKEVSTCGTTMIYCKAFRYSNFL